MHSTIVLCLYFISLNGSMNIRKRDKSFIYELFIHLSVTGGPTNEGVSGMYSSRQSGERTGAPPKVVFLKL